MDQLVEIIKVNFHHKMSNLLDCVIIVIASVLILDVVLQVLGTPTREEIRCMNPSYTDFRFPQIKAHPWHKVLHYIIEKCWLELLLILEDRITY